MSRVSSLALAVPLALAGPAWSQEAAEEVHGDDDHHYHDNHVAVFLGGTSPFDQERAGKTSFTVGADYERRFTQAVGAMALADFAFGDLTRTALFAALFAGRPIADLRLAIGPGIEFVEEDEILEDGSTSTKHTGYFVISTRATYDFHVGVVSLTPAAGLDFVGETKTAFVYGGAVGIGF